MVFLPLGRKTGNLCRHGSNDLRLGTMETLTWELGLGTCWPRGPARQTGLCIAEGKGDEKTPWSARPWPWLKCRRHMVRMLSVTGSDDAVSVLP